MLKKSITYTDYNGNLRTEDFYFNLSKAELVEMEMQTAGGLQNMLEKIVAEQDNKRITEMFKTLILKAYGEKSPDGKRFVKSPEISAAFEQTEAYVELFMELFTDADKAAKFFTGIVPKVDNMPELKDAIPASVQTQAE